MPATDWTAPASLVPLGHLIRGKRLELKLTQRQVARNLRVGLATLRNWEAGRAKVRDRYRPRVIRFLGFDPNPARSFPERIRAARHAAGLSQKALALRLGLDPSTVRIWEAGRGESGQGRVRRLLEDFVEEEFGRRGI
jgi:DNA-binding transcriptional regulator YiaG